MDKRATYRPSWARRATGTAKMKMEEKKPLKKNRKRGINERGRYSWNKQVRPVKSVSATMSASTHRLTPRGCNVSTDDRGTLRNAHGKPEQRAFRVAFPRPPLEHIENSGDQGNKFRTLLPFGRPEIQIVRLARWLIRV